MCPERFDMPRSFNGNKIDFTKIRVSKGSNKLLLFLHMYFPFQFSLSWFIRNRISTAIISVPLIKYFIPVTGDLIIAGTQHPHTYGKKEYSHWPSIVALQVKLMLMKQDQNTTWRPRCSGANSTTYSCIWKTVLGGPSAWAPASCVQIQEGVPAPSFIPDKLQPLWPFGEWTSS